MAAGARDLALDDEHPVRSRVPRLLQQRRSGALGLEVKHRLDGRAVGAGADEVGVGARAHDEEDRVDHDGLPRPGLAGDRVEAWAEGHGHRLDDREVLEAQTARLARRAPPACWHPTADEDDAASRIRLETPPARPTARPT